MNPQNEENRIRSTLNNAKKEELIKMHLEMKNKYKEILNKKKEDYLKKIEELRKEYHDMLKVQMELFNKRRDELKKKYNDMLHIKRNQTKQSVRKCVLIGINYIGQNGQLGGCINDTINLKAKLIEKEYFSNDNFTMLNDNMKGTKLYPTKNNIWSQLDELKSFANNNKNKEVLLFLSYSGHGSYVPDRNGDEDDGRDEVLCPVDYNQAGFIVDDNIKSRFIDQLPQNVKLVILIDACHSGTILDLRYNYDVSGSFKINEKNQEAKCDIVMISGCLDKQTSADAYLQDNSGNMMYQGAMTVAFLNSYEDGISYKDLLTKMREWLKKNRFKQIPQLSSGKKIDINEPFLLSKYRII